MLCGPYYPPGAAGGALIRANINSLRKIPSYDDNIIGKFFSAPPSAPATGLTSLAATVQSTGIRQAAANVIRSSKIIRKFGLGKTIGVGLGATAALATASAVSRGRMRRREREEMEQM